MTQKDEEDLFLKSQQQPQTGRDLLNIADGFLKKSQAEKSVVYIQKALYLFEQEQDWEQYIEARSWYIYVWRIVRSESVLKNPEAYVEETLRLCGQFIPPIHKVNYYVLTEVSGFYTYTNQLEKGLEYALKQLEIAKQLFDSLDSGVVEAYRNVSVSYQFLGNYPKSIEYGLSALQKCEENGDKIRFIKVSLPLYVNYAKYGDYDNAFLIITKALEVANELKDNKVEMPVYFFIHIYNNIASYYNFIGDYQEALMYYQNAFSTIKKQYDKNGEQGFLATLIQRNVGNALIKSGHLEDGLHYLQVALKNQEKLGGANNSDIGVSHIALARYYERVKNYSLLLYHAECALDMFADIHNEQHPRVLTSRKLIARAQTCLGNYQEALLIFEELITQSKSFWGENHIETALIYQDLVHHYLQNSQIDEAVSGILESERIFLKKTENKESQSGKWIFTNQFFTTTQLKEKVYFQRYLNKTKAYEDIATAFQSCKEAVGLLDEMRKSYHQESSKLVWSTAESDLFDRGIITSIELGKFTTDFRRNAFWFSEKAKASLLLNTLQSNFAKATTHILPRLLEEEKQMKLQLTYLDKRLQQLEKKNNDELQKYRNEFFNLHTKYLTFIEQLEVDYPDYYQLKYNTKAATPVELQSVLQENQVLISYFVGKEKLYIFVLTPDEFEVIELQKPTDFEALIEGFIENLTQHEFTAFASKSHRLHQLLIDPIRDFIIDDFSFEEDQLKQIFIIPHETLSYVPFEALIGEKPLSSQLLPTALHLNNSWQKLDYLVNHCEISYHYSATLLYRHLTKKQNQEEILNSFAGFAPIYDVQIPSKSPTANLPESEQADALQESAKAMQSWATRSDAIRSDGTWVSLPHSETEAKGIAELFEGKGLESEVFLREKASKTGFAEAAKRFKFLLVAAHGLVNDEKTALSGLVFYPSDRSEKRDERGETGEFHNEEDTERGGVTNLASDFSLLTSQTDSVLSMEETHHLELQADLVVLSSCESGIGILHKGE
ncbi:MAG: CHAT domain-containing protein [Chitinophagales bacterium]